MSCLVKALAGCRLPLAAPFCPPPPPSQDCRLDSWDRRGSGLLWGQQEGPVQDCKSNGEFPCLDVLLSLFRQLCGRNMSVGRPRYSCKLSTSLRKVPPFPWVLCQKKHDYTSGKNQAGSQETWIWVLALRCTELLSKWLHLPRPAFSSERG